MMRMYKFTHKNIEVVQGGGVNTENTVVPKDVTLANLTMFSTILFAIEFQKAGLGDTVDVSTTCNMSEWMRRLYSGSIPLPDVDGEEYVDVLTLPPKPIWKSGFIYATTCQSDKGEAYSSFLFACHKPALVKTVTPSKEPSQTVKDLAAENGVTHIWLCGSDPEQRRHHLMTQCLAQLEKDVSEWRVSGQGSGLITVHTIPNVFPGMVQFLLKNGFQGGDKIFGDTEGKVLYWKAL